MKQTDFGLLGSFSEEGPSVLLFSFCSSVAAVRGAYQRKDKESLRIHCVRTWVRGGRLGRTDRAPVNIAFLET